MSLLLLIPLNVWGQGAADEAIAGDDMMNDDDYFCRDLLVLENVEAIAVEDHISVSPWPIDGFLEEEKNVNKICKQLSRAIWRKKK